VLGQYGGLGLHGLGKTLYRAGDGGLEIADRVGQDNGVGLGVRRVEHSAEQVAQRVVQARADGAEGDAGQAGSEQNLAAGRRAGRGVGRG
jgi:hypothetical protein